MNTALTIIGLAMFIFIIVFTLKRAKEKRQAQQKEHEKIKEYGDEWSIDNDSLYVSPLLKKLTKITWR